MNRASLWIPLGVFALVSGFLFVGFYLEDPHELPSALLDKPLPAFELEKLGSGEVVGTEDMLGEPFLLNVWATWCPTCRAEHGELERIAGEFGVPIYGVNYKDDPAERWSGCSATAIPIVSPWWTGAVSSVSISASTGRRRPSSSIAGA